MNPFIQRYHESLKDKLEYLQVFSDDCSQLSERKEELLQTLHKVTGSGGMYGYDDLSDKARALHENIKSSAINDESDQKLIGKEIAELITFINNIIIAI